MNHCCFSFSLIHVDITCNHFGKREIEIETIFLLGRFQKKVQKALSGTQNTVKTDTGKIKIRKIISGPLFQTERRTKKELTINTTGEINPKNTHCLQGLDGKYARWDGILRDILNRKFKIVQNGKETDTETEDDDDEDDEDVPEEIGTPKTYDTSERSGKYLPIRTNPEEDALQIHTDGEIPGETVKSK